MKIFLFILLMLLSSAIIIAIDFLFIDKERKPSLIVMKSIKIFFIINLINFSFIHLLWGYKNIFLINRQEYLYSLYYFLNNLLVGGLYILYRYLVQRFFIVEKKELTKKGGAITLFIFSIIFVFVGMMGFLATSWATTVNYDVSFDQIFITMFTPITGTDSKIMNSFYEGPLLISSTVTYLFALIFYKHLDVKYIYKKHEKFIAKDKISRILSITLSSVLLVSGLTYTVVGLQIDKVVLSYLKEDPYIENHYVDPAKVELTVPSKKRNLIHIYLESIENSYFDKAHGGMMEENLMPNLLALHEEGVSFSNLSKEEGCGGPLKTYGGSFSCGSMVNQFFGVPMRVPTTINQYSGKDKFLPGAIGVGDILNYLGYNQTMMLGAEAKFGGLDHMFTDHGNFKIYDYKYMKENKLIPSDYQVNWGVEDAKLYEFAKQELLDLASKDKPFHFFMENADTHNPGFAFNGDEPVFEESNYPISYAKTIKFSEKHVYEFIKWIQAQDFYENTTVVIIGDHNTMDGSLFRNGQQPDDFIRTTYNLILNPDPALKAAVDESRYYNRQWSNFDMMPTILEALGFKVEGHKLGLGTSLFSDLPTTFEEEGYEKVNKSLINKSKFYNQTFVKNKVTYNGENLVIL